MRVTSFLNDWWNEAMALHSAPPLAPRRGAHTPPPARVHRTSRLPAAACCLSKGARGLMAPGSLLAYAWQPGLDHVLVAPTSAARARCMLANDQPCSAAFIRGRC